MADNSDLPPSGQSPAGQRKGPGCGCLIIILVALFFAGSWTYNSLRTKDPGEAAFRKASMAIMTDENGVYLGNTPEAIRTAELFSQMMVRARDLFFTEAKKGGLSLSGGEFITYCHIADGKCALMVHVPKLRKFTDEAKGMLGEISWGAAWMAVGAQDLPVREIGVGVKGALLFSTVYVGPFDPASEEPGEPAVREEGSSGEALLYPFFLSADEAPAP